MTSDTYRKNHGMLSGWIPDSGKGDTDLTDVDYNAGYYWRKKIYNDKKKGTVIFPLKNLFGFCDYTKILYLLKINLSLIRKDDSVINPDIFYGAAGTKAKIKMERLDFHIPYIVPSLGIEELITKRLISKKPIDVVFMKINANEITIPTGSLHSWRVGNYKNSVRYLFLAFKKTDSPTFQTNNALFCTGDGTHQITSLRVQLNNMYYPIDNMRFDFANWKLNEPYVAYINSCKTFGVEPQLNLQEFRDLYAVFAVDLSAQPENLRLNGIDLTIHIEKDSQLTLQSFCLVLEDVHYSIDVEGGRMLRIS